MFNKETKTEKRNRLARMFVRGDYSESHYDYARRLVRANGKEYAAQRMLQCLIDEKPSQELEGVGITHIRRAIAMNF